MFEIVRDIIITISCTIGTFGWIIVIITARKNSSRVSSMIGKRVTAYEAGNYVTGIIRDKVNIPIKSGTDGYVPMDSYMIETSDGKILPINPVMIIKG